MNDTTNQRKAMCVTCLCVINVRSDGRFCYHTNHGMNNLRGYYKVPCPDSGQSSELPNLSRIDLIRRRAEFLSDSPAPTMCSRPGCVNQLPKEQRSYCSTLCRRIVINLRKTVRNRMST